MKQPSRAIQIDLKTLLGKSPEHEMVFTESNNEEEVFHQKDLIEMEVYGLSMNPDPNHPFLLLKDKTEKYVLSVMISEELNVVSIKEL